MNNYLKILCLSLSAILMVNSSFAAMNFPDDLGPLIGPGNIKLIRALNLIDDAEKQGLINRLGKNRQHAISMLLEKVSLTKEDEDEAAGSLQGMIEIIMDYPSFNPNIFLGPNPTLLIQAIHLKDDVFKHQRIEKLLKRKANPDEQSEIGTPLYEAVNINDLKTVKLLLEYNANTNIKGTNDGLTPYQLAVKRKYDDIIAVFLEHGAISKIHSKINEEENIKANLSAHLATDLATLTMSYLFRPPQLSCGKEHTCSIDIAGKLICWASKDSGPFILPDELKDDDVQKVAVGDGKACAISSAGRLYCWKIEESGGKISLPDELKNDRVEQISVSVDTACAINSVGKLICWKMNEPYARSEKISLPDELKNVQVRKVAIGGRNNFAMICAINSVGKLVCFEKTFVACRTWFSVPDELENERIEQVAVGPVHACAINSAKKLFCWGRDNPRGARIPDEFKNEQVKQVSVGDNFTCATNKDGKLFCWGSHCMIQESIPFKLRNDRVEQISAGPYHTCAINSQSQLFCWGYNAPRTPWRSF